MKYDSYIEKAFQYAVRDILNDVAKNGLEGDSHFFITFQTNRDDVVIPDFVRAKYPEEITIVLQHQFENLKADGTKIQVDLAFGGVLSTLTIPYTALKQFADPSHQFALAFNPKTSNTVQKENVNSPATIINLDQFRKK